MISVAKIEFTVNQTRPQMRYKQIQADNLKKKTTANG